MRSHPIVQYYPETVFARESPFLSLEKKAKKVIKKKLFRKQLGSTCAVVRAAGLTARKAIRRLAAMPLGWSAIIWSIARTLMSLVR